MSDPADLKTNDVVPAVEVEDGVSRKDQGHDLDEKAEFVDYKADAVEAENAEHNMGVLEAVKAYPMASFWAFVMSFTIVSCLSLTRSFQFSPRNCS